MSDINITAFSTVDFVIIGIILFSILISFVRGFVREALSLAAWILAFWLAYKFTPNFTEVFANHISNPSVRYAIVFFIIFLIVLLIGAFINFIISSLISKTGLSMVDRVLGIFFGFARAVLLMGILVLMGNQTNMQKNTWWAKSQLIPQFQGLADWLKGILPDQMKQFNDMIKPVNDHPTVINRNIDMTIEPDK